jgi:CspA family cold shock protein
MRGTVKFFCDTRGYGFIRPDAGGHDVFVHRTDLDESCHADHALMLIEGERVSFEIVERPKGRKAQAVHVERRQAATEEHH